jgi:pSer/pThr/pTyr-binding forkhead associated (FHA) protein
MCTLTVKLDSLPAEPGPPTIAVGSSVRHQRSRAARLGGDLNSQTTSLTLPLHKTIKISVIAGPSQGLEYELSRPLVTIGRLGGGGDIEIDDPEISRLHCAVEVRRDAILLHDLRSTNGTYLGDSRVFAARLEEMSTFRVGSSLLQMSSEPKLKPKTKPL